MDTQTYRYGTGTFFPDGVVISTENFIARRDNSGGTYLQPPGRANSISEFVSGAVDYKKNKEGIWVTGFERADGFFPRELSSDSEEAKALDRLSKLTIREKLILLGRSVEMVCYSYAN